MPRKTRKQKVAATQRVGQPVASEPTLPDTSTPKFKYTFRAPRTTPAQKSTATSINTSDYSYLVKDLRKIFFITSFILLLELMLFYVTSSAR